MELTVNEILKLIKDNNLNGDSRIFIYDITSNGLVHASKAEVDEDKDLIIYPE